jgi:hypothetical protein
MTAPYTPLPWQFDPLADRLLSQRGSDPVVVASGLIASDARFIVTAVNHHYRLIAAVIRARTLLTLRAPPQLTAPLVDQLIDEIRILLTTIIGDPT